MIVRISNKYSFFISKENITATKIIINNIADKMSRVNGGKKIENSIKTTQKRFKNNNTFLIWKILLPSIILILWKLIAHV